MQYRLALRGAAQHSTAQHSRVGSAVNVVGCGGCNNTDDVSVESEPACKASLVPAVGTNGIADQSAASSQGSSIKFGLRCGEQRVLNRSEPLGSPSVYLSCPGTYVHPLASLQGF